MSRYNARHEAKKNRQALRADTTRRVYKPNGERERERRVYQIKQAQLNQQNGLSD